jgi:RsiW-degrading membrane proteinase PrsW (M82 family)
MSHEILTPEEKAKQQRITLVVALCIGGFVLILQFFPEGESRPLAILVALALWGIAAITMVLTVPRFVKKMFTRFWQRR